MSDVTDMTLEFLKNEHNLNFVDKGYFTWSTLASMSVLHEIIDINNIREWKFTSRSARIALVKI